MGKSCVASYEDGKFSITGLTVDDAQAALLTLSKCAATGKSESSAFDGGVVDEATSNASSKPATVKRTVVKEEAAKPAPEKSTPTGVVPPAVSGAKNIASIIDYLVSNEGILTEDAAVVRMAELQKLHTPLQRVPDLEVRVRKIFASKAAEATA